MAVRVTSPRKASPNGKSVHLYKAGYVYDENSKPPMPAALQEVFLREGWAEPADVVPVKTTKPEPSGDGGNEGETGAETNAPEDGGTDATPRASEDSDAETEAEPEPEQEPTAPEGGDDRSLASRFGFGG